MTECIFVKAQSDKLPNIGAFMMTIYFASNPDFTSAEVKGVKAARKHQMGDASRKNDKCKEQQHAFNKYGRKITLQYGFVASAVFLIAQGYTPDWLTWVKVSLFLFGKMGVVICFTCIYTYSLELFPTSVRGTLLGCSNTAARFGSMLAPLTPLLMTEVAELPFIIFSAVSITAALLLTFTPETKTLPMFDTIAQIESYKSSQSKICTKL